MRNNKQKISPPHLAIRYAASIRRVLGERIREIRLFGSQARGDASSASDYDFLIVLDRKDRAIRGKILDIGAQMMNECDQLFAALVYQENEWDIIRNTPLGWNIQAEGVAL